MTNLPGDAAGLLRQAVLSDGPQLLALWRVLFDDPDSPPSTGWETQAQEWFARCADDPASTRLPVIEHAGEVVAAASGTLEIGIPNPYSPTGRLVRLANVITLPNHRGRGCATALIGDVIAWAVTIEADRVDLSATSAGERLYEQLGFVRTSAPRMKLVL